MLLYSEFYWPRIGLYMEFSMLFETPKDSKK